MRERELTADRGAIRNFEDLLRIRSEATQALGLCLLETDFVPEFFDLRSGLAGELFQKLVNYRIRTAIVLPDPGKYGTRISELALEHRTHPVVRIFQTVEAAKAWLASIPTHDSG
ncbi:MAG TPA: DUF4180 domain-containing protein [Steroidobacteraceae bacterium]